MRLAFAIVWLALALLFLVLGRFHWLEADRAMPAFELSESAYEVSGSGFQVKIGVGGTPLDQPFRQFADDLNAWVDEQNEVAHATHRRAAGACFVAAAAAVVALLLQLRVPRPRAASNPT
jgi:hypothetical protein